MPDFPGQSGSRHSCIYFAGSNCRRWSRVTKAVRGDARWACRLDRPASQDCPRTMTALIAGGRRRFRRALAFTMAEGDRVDGFSRPLRSTVATKQPARQRWPAQRFSGYAKHAQRKAGLAFVRRDLSGTTAPVSRICISLPCERGRIPLLERLDYATISGSIEPSGEHRGIDARRSRR
jgi:hypothetical protein